MLTNLKTNGRSYSNIRPDFSFSAPDGRVVLIIEVKNRLNTDRRWAAEMRRNLYAHSGLPVADNFLLALPDKFYLWRESANTPDVVEPDFEIDAAIPLGPIFQRLGIAPESMSNETFELLINIWIEDLLLNQSGENSAWQDWLALTGLQDVIQKDTTKQVA